VGDDVRSPGQLRNRASVACVLSCMKVFRMNRKTVSLVLCFLAVVPVSACGNASSASDRTGQVRASTSPSTDLEQSPDANASENDGVSRMTDAVTRVAGTDWRSVLGGLHWDARTKQLVIYVVDGPNANALQTNIDRAVSAVQGDYSHRFVAVGRSFEELRGLAAGVMSDRKVWAGNFASDIVSVGPDPAIDGLRVVVTGHVAELKDRVQRRLGGVPVAVERGARGSAL